MMTKKDYEKIASVLYQFRAPIGDGMDFLDHLCEAFAHMLEKDNPRFDRQRFFKAAGYEGSIVD